MSDTTVYLESATGALVAMRRQVYRDEAELQDVIAKNPELLTGGLGDRRYLLVKKEMEVPDRDGGLGRWSLDHLFVDDRAIPTLIEVKQASNREIRRLVIGQLLDYAANGMEYWPPGALRRSHLTRLGDDETAANEEVARLTANLNPDEFWDLVESNLRVGRVRLVVLADAIPKELQRVVEFLNERMPDTEVLAMEVAQFLGDGHRTFVPRIVGRTSVAQRTKDEGGRRFAQLLAESSPETRDLHQLLTAWVLEREGETTEANQSLGYLAEGHYLVRLYPSDNSLEMSLSRWSSEPLPPEAAALRQDLVRLCPDKKLTKKTLYLPTRDVVANWDQFSTDILPRYLAYVTQRDTDPSGDFGA